MRALRKFDIFALVGALFFAMSSTAMETSHFDSATFRPKSAVQNRIIDNENTWMIQGSVGLSERKDFFTTQLASLSLKHYFTKSFAVEFFRYTSTTSKITSSASDVIQTTDYRLDQQTSSAQYSAAAIWSMIYGKYTTGEDSLVRFDGYLLAGAGLRIAEKENQPFVRLGLGTQHYLTRNWVLGGQLQVRFYKETRNYSATISEFMPEFNVGWIY